MAQPPAYNPSTDFSDEERDNVGGRSTVRTAALDGELTGVAASINALRDNLFLIQRDDGELRDGIVKLYSLSQDVLNLLVAQGDATPRGPWLTATAYGFKDLVTQGGITYIAVTAHTSGVFATDLAAGKWLLISLGAAPTAASIPFAPTASIAATNVQAAIDEADTEARALTNLLRADITNSVDPAKGPGMIPLNQALTFPAGSLGAAVRNGGTPVVTSIAALRAINSLSTTNAFVSGYYVAGDGGGGLYYMDSADLASADNGGTIIVATDSARWKLVYTDSVSLLQFGADKTGVADSTAALTNCITAVALTFIPAGTFKVTGNIIVPAGRRVGGAGKHAAFIDKRTNSNIFLLNGWYFDITDVGFELNGDTYATGSMFVQGGNTNYHKFTRLYFNNFKAPAFENTAAEAGNQSAWLSCEFHPVASALFTPAIKFSPIQDAGAGNRRIIDSNAQGGQLVDLGGTVETYLTNCFSNGFGNGSRLADLCKISNSRVALVGSPQYIYGQGFNINNCDFPGPVVLRNSGTNSLSFRNNSAHSLSWGNGKYNNINMESPYRWVNTAGTSTLNALVLSPGVTAGDIFLKVANAGIYQVGQSVVVAGTPNWVSVIDGIEVTTNMLLLRNAAPGACIIGNAITVQQCLLSDGFVSTTYSATAGSNQITVASGSGITVGSRCYLQGAGIGGDAIMSVVRDRSGTLVTIADTIENPSGVTAQAFYSQGTPVVMGSGGEATMLVTREGQKVAVECYFKLGGAGLAMGAGSLTLWLPALADAQISQPVFAQLFDASPGADYILRGVIGAGLPFVQFALSGVTFNSTYPVTLAQNDVLSGNFSYQVY